MWSQWLLSSLPCNYALISELSIIYSKDRLHSDHLLMLYITWYFQTQTETLPRRVKRSSSMSCSRRAAVTAQHLERVGGSPMDTSSASSSVQRGRPRRSSTSRVRHHSAPARRVRDRSQLHVRYYIFSLFIIDFIYIHGPIHHVTYNIWFYSWLVPLLYIVKTILWHVSCL